jgi:hypothetical protein
MRILLIKSLALFQNPPKFPKEHRFLYNDGGFVDKKLENFMKKRRRNSNTDAMKMSDVLQFLSEIHAELIERTGHDLGRGMLFFDAIGRKPIQVVNLSRSFNTGHILFIYVRKSENKRPYYLHPSIPAPPTGKVIVRINLIDTGFLIGAVKSEFITHRYGYFSKDMTGQEIEDAALEFLKHPTWSGSYPGMKVRGPNGRFHRPTIQYKYYPLGYASVVCFQLKKKNNDDRSWSTDPFSRISFFDGRILYHTGSTNESKSISMIGKEIGVFVTRSKSNLRSHTGGVLHTWNSRHPVTLVNVMRPSRAAARRVLNDKGVPNNIAQKILHMARLTGNVNEYSKNMNKMIKNDRKHRNYSSNSSNKRKRQRV